MYYEALWFIVGHDDYNSKSFRSKKAALNFYNRHKDDPDKEGWWVTKRDEEGIVLEDYIY